MSCNINSGAVFACTDKVGLIGGFKPKFWVYNLEDVEAYTIAVNGDVTNLDLKTGKKIYPFEALKDTLTANASITKVEGSGIAICTHSVTFKGVDITSEQRKVFEVLANAEAVAVIAETTSGRFEIFGKDFGMKLGDANEKNYGANPTEDTSRNVSLASAGEPFLPKIFFDTSASVTFAKIVALETAQP